MRDIAAATRFKAVGLIIALLLAALWFAAQLYGVFEFPDFTDFHVVCAAAQAIAGGHDPYDIKGLLSTPFAAHYKYPPFLAVVMSYCLFAGQRTLAWTFVGISLLLYGLTFILMLQVAKLRLLTWPAAVLAIGFMVWQPSIDTLSGAQQEFVLLFLFTAACWAATRGERAEILLGAAIASCAIVKVYPALMMADFALRRWAKSVAAFLAFICLYTILAALKCGWALQVEFWLRIFPILRGGTAADENQSLLGFFDRFYVNGVTVDETLFTSVPTATLLYHIACAIILIASFAVLTRASAPRDAFKILLPAMLLMAPTSWIHYEELMLLPLGLLLADLRARVSVRQCLPLLVGFLLIACGNEVTIMNVPWTLAHSYKTYGLLIFWLMGLSSALCRGSLSFERRSALPTTSA